MAKAAIDLKNITKRFGKVVANKDVCLSVYKGEILSLLGENGSGKTTLMNMISGIYYPDEGQIFIDGEEVVIRSPKDAFKYKIGMIHQHFKLIDVFSAAQNIVLGLNEEEKFDIKTVTAKVKQISEQYGFDIDPNKKIYEMSVSEKQTVEIIKVLYRGADILILDEPTAVLTPQETQKLFAVLRRMKESGKAIIIITHKLHEVLSLSDKVAVLRKGEYIGTVVTAETNESQLTEMMVGKKISLNINRSEPVDPTDRLVVKNLCCLNPEGIKMLDDISFAARSGEILGIAGIAGSGQRELLEAIAGLQPIESGEIIYNNPKTGAEDELRGKTPIQIRELGVRLSFVPEDRLGMGLVGNMDIIDNMMLRSYRKGKSMFLERKKPKDLAQRIIKDLEVITPSAQTPVRKLSGGNVQKVLVGREIAASPTVLMAAYPVRGLDINSSYTIYNLLNDQKENGVAVIFVGEDLDVLVELCDRIIVVNSGKITGELDARHTTKEEIGLLMTKVDGGAKDMNEELTKENETENVTHKWRCKNCGEMAHSFICSHCGQESYIKSDVSFKNTGNNVEKPKAQKSAPANTMPVDIGQANNEEIKKLSVSVNAILNDLKTHAKVLKTVGALVIALICLVAFLGIKFSSDIKNLSAENTALNKELSAKVEEINNLKKQTADNNEENEVVYIVHIVQPGDSLNSICNKYGVDYSAYKKIILSVNGIQNANVIYDGQALLIPVVKADNK